MHSARRVHEVHPTTIIMYQSDLKHRILEAAKSDLQYKELVAKLQQGNLQQKIEEYKSDDDEIIMYMGHNLCTKLSGIEKSDIERNA
jgi:hypothetical protein